MPPWVVDMELYSANDMCLGEFLGIMNQSNQFIIPFNIWKRDFLNKQFKLSSKQSESFTIENFDSILSDSFCFSPDYVCPEKDCATPILQAEMTPKL